MNTYNFATNVIQEIWYYIDEKNEKKRSVLGSKLLDLMKDSFEETEWANIEKSILTNDKEELENTIIILENRLLTDNNLLNTTERLFKSELEKKNDNKIDWYLRIAFAILIIERILLSEYEFNLVIAILAIFTLLLIIVQKILILRLIICCLFFIFVTLLLLMIITSDYNYNTAPIMRLIFTINVVLLELMLVFQLRISWLKWKNRK